MSVFLFKLVAIVTMLIDHMGDSFFNNNMVMRSIGRFAFPIYAFLLAEGFRHIRSSDRRISAHAAKLYSFTAVNSLIILK